MILPQTYGLVLILLALSFFCWGSWANTFKLAGKYRFELYSIDFALGFMAIALLCAFTVGNLGYDGFQFFDDLEHAGKRQWFFGFVAGVIFNLANMLLLAAISVSGMAVAFPIGIGTGIIVGALLSLVLKPGVNLSILFTGCALLVAAAVMAAAAHNILGVIRHENLARAGMTKSTRRPTSWKGVILAVIGGLMMGCFTPILRAGMETDAGLGPYSITVVFAAGVLLSTMVFSVFFMSLPAEGDAVDPLDYLRSALKRHSLGLLGGAIWCTGSVAALAAATAPATAQVAPALNNLLLQGYPLLAALYGILIWKEFREGDMRVKLSAVIMLFLLAGGLTLISFAPVIRKG